MLDLDAYLERISLSGRPGLAEVHRAHSTTIPFENLAPHQGQAVSLEDAELERKLVAGRRGGYCFEQNMLLARALRELGAEVDLHLARVRFGAPAGVDAPADPPGAARAHRRRELARGRRLRHGDASGPRPL